MYPINLEKVLADQTGNNLIGKSKIFKQILLKLLKKILYVDTINKFLQQQKKQFVLKCQKVYFQQKYIISYTL